MREREREGGRERGGEGGREREGEGGGEGERERERWPLILQCNNHHKYCVSKWLKWMYVGENKECLVYLLTQCMPSSMVIYVYIFNKGV